jgi:hypothetical protein
MMPPSATSTRWKNCRRSNSRARAAALRSQRCGECRQQRGPQRRPADSALHVAQAQRLIAEQHYAARRQPHRALFSALDRVLAQDVISPINVPAYDNSAMDGYALRGADLPDAAQAQPPSKS